MTPVPTRKSVAMPGRIRRLGPLAAFAVPAVLVAMALLLRLAPCDGLGCVQTQSASWLLVLLAVPTALVTGVPVLGGPVPYVLALVTASALWIAVGRYAAELATEDIDATWREWAYEVGAIVAGIWAGFVGLAVVAYVLLGLV